MARSSASVLPRSAPRKAAGRPRAAGPGGPHQLSLFSPGHPGLEIDPPRRGVVLPPAPPILRTSADRPEAVFLRRLNRFADGRIHSAIPTDNRKTILSVRPVRGSSSIDLRLHRCFLEAPDEILEAVAAFVLARRGSETAREALRLLREHFAKHRGKIPRKELRRKLEPVGETCDLRDLAAAINQDYFEGRLKVDITWGKASVGSAHRCQRGGRATIQLGSYSYDDRLVRIHRVLDRPEVPRYVVEAVVYHELLHAAMPPVIEGGRRHYHTPEFRRREKLFAGFARADKWVTQNLPSLLKARRKAKR